MGLNTVFPYLKPTSEGEIIIDIFEHTLSEHGVYNLIIKVDKDHKIESIFIRKTTYGRDSIEAKFKSLEEALSYIQKHHYYQYYEDYERDEKERAKNREDYWG